MTAPYVLLRSARRTLSITVKPDGTVLVRAPRFAGSKEIERFVESRRAWIEKAREKIARRPVFSDDPEEIARLCAAARETLPRKVDFYARKMGLFPEKVRVGKAKTRFGSCSDRKQISFSCYLMLYPDEAIDYVVVHELAHLRYMDHGSRFYALIASVLPDYKERIRLLKNEERNP